MTLFMNIVLWCCYKPTDAYDAAFVCCKRVKGGGGGGGGGLCTGICLIIIQHEIVVHSEACERG